MWIFLSPPFPKPLFSLYVCLSYLSVYLSLPLLSSPIYLYPARNNYSRSRSVFLSLSLIAGSYTDRELALFKKMINI